MSNTISTAANNITLAVTPGEPAGIGPDLCVLLAGEDLPARIVFIADREMLRERAELLGLRFDIPDYAPDVSAAFSIEHHPLSSKAIPGKPDASNSGPLLEALERATAGCLNR